MKEKPIAIFITLLGGAVSSICCILKGAGLLWTLFITFISLLVFMIVGLIVNKMITEVKNEVEEKEKIEARRAEEERREKELAALEAIENGGRASEEQNDDGAEPQDGSAVQNSDDTDNTADEEGV